MIVKIKGSDAYSRFGSKYELKIVDKFGNSFRMLVGGNYDLYWLPDDFKDCHDTFYIDKTDEIFYRTLDKLFEDIKTKDDKYRPTLKENTFTFISEDYNEDEANSLQIIKNDQCYEIKFIKNPNNGTWGTFRRGCVICFCNSGSRVPAVEQLFQLVFNDFAYYNDEIEMEK